MKRFFLILAALALAGCASDPQLGGEHCTYWKVEKQRCTEWTIGQMHSLDPNWIFKVQR